MNMQAMLKQAQKLQKDMMKSQEELNGMIFEGKSSIVEAKVNGKKEILGIKINSENIDLDDVELIEDMIVVALNDAMKKVDEKTKEKMGAYTNGIPGLF